MPLHDDQKLRVPEQVLSRNLDDETVILDLKAGMYFGLNEVGATVWDLARTGSTIAEIRAKLLDDYDVEPEVLERDLERLVRDLEQRGLVEIED